MIGNWRSKGVEEMAHVLEMLLWFSILSIRIRCSGELCSNCFQYRKQSPEDETSLTLKMSVVFLTLSLFVLFAPTVRTNDANYELCQNANFRRKLIVSLPLERDSKELDESFEGYHPHSSFLKPSNKVGPTSPFVKISANWSLVPIFFTTITPSFPLSAETYCLNQWYLTAMCLDLGVIRGSSIFATVKAPTLSSQMVVCIDTTFSLLTSNAAAISFIKSCKRISSWHTVLMAMYSASMVEAARN